VELLGCSKKKKKKKKKMLSSFWHHTDLSDADISSSTENFRSSYRIYCQALGNFEEMLTGKLSNSLSCTRIYDILRPYANAVWETGTSVVENTGRLHRLLRRLILAASPASLLQKEHTARKAADF
jgi:hypothetical protein